MGRPYHKELRERAVDAYEDGEGTYQEIAERFAVGSASVIRWVARARYTGSVDPNPMGGARHPYKIGENGLLFVKAVVTDVPDSTLPELVAAYEEEFGVRVGAETMRQALIRLGYSKKKPSGERRRPSDLKWSKSGRASPQK
jgi:transposase